MREKQDSLFKSNILNKTSHLTREQFGILITMAMIEDDKLTEKIVQKWIDENPTSFCEALGEGYTYVKSQYKIKIGSNYNYIDVLLFNVINMNYVVVEIKVTELKKEHIGQIETYMNYVDTNLKKEFHNKTTGILLVRDNNKWLIKYINNDEIKVRKYITSEEQVSECLGGLK